MILPKTPRQTLRPPRTISSDEREPRDRALEDLAKENQWIDDFVKRLNYTIEDMVGKK
jgi:hypothetical protein